MTNHRWVLNCGIACSLVMALVLLPGLVWAAPASFDWGSMSAAGSTGYGVYDADDATILQTGDLAQLIWAGPDGIIALPNCDGSPAGDDRLLQTSTIQNGGSLPPPAHSKGYLPLNTYTYDPGGQLDGGVVYLRAWNASTVEAATAYGNSGTGTLVAGSIYNAGRWHTDIAWSAAAIVPLVSVAQDAANVVLTWPANEANAQYQVWVSTDPYFDPDGVMPTIVTADTTYTDIGAAASTENHFYVIRGLTACGAASANSNRTGEFTFVLTPGS